MLCQNQPQQHSFTLHESMVSRYHTHPVSPNQCSSTVIQTIDAPIGLVWSVVRRFDNPQAYKHFIRSCSTNDDGSIGSVREVRIVSGLPAGTSTERLDALDDDGHVISFSIVGGDHRLSNYRSTTTLHEIRGEGGEARPRTVVIESYVVDVPPGNTRDDTCVFADTIVRFNLRSLAEMSEKLARATAAA